jgi:N-acetyl sugar amidotransferase
MIRCTRCLMPDTRPRIVFTDGVCNACLYHESKKEIDWDARKKEFLEVVERHRGRGPYDCVVPFSGGKDSATIAWRLKFEFGLNPLLVCYGQLLWTEVGRRNLDRVCSAGFDIIYWRVSQRVSRSLAKRFFIERGHPKQHYDAGVNSVPVRIAVNFELPLIFYAEHGESEYGGCVLSDEHRRTRDLTEVLENQIGDDPRNWATGDLNERDLYPYIYPDKTDIERVGVKAFYFSYFFPWLIYENAKFARDEMGFEPASNTDGDWPNYGHIADPKTDWPLLWGKSDGSFEGFDSIDDKIDDLDFFMMNSKFGFGRATRMASRLIQGGHMTREMGMELVERYDGEFPETYLTDVLDYLDMTREELGEVIEKHRNPTL